MYQNKAFIYTKNYSDKLFVAIVHNVLQIIFKRQWPSPLAVSRNGNVTFGKI